ncbi:hypothetical protein GCM10011519_01870 [Marmoricola endophyticus]|uniref:Mycothiol-dependent maleylpyruvate isomerase metal-binding domain-containing protein n=1 Tax=Marmoricola endophyticus TaxID=2040280 RepID=A0A917EYF4_9ACTN|nr:maleylpyruvate isomerase family mycothiol-dependent enzyme [Marmoricola endophyticus]GGF32093.1 hypothetical protein GCM10011519_01870 [Marmoricola endophyticus]
MTPEAILSATTAMRLETADWLDTLSDDQLDHPSLCAGWRVREVAGHLAQAGAVSVPAMFVQVARSGFNPHRANTAFARRFGADRPQDLIRTHAEKKLDLPFVGVHGQFVDLQVHGADMRVPLDAAWVPPVGYAAEALRFLEGGAIGFAPRKRVAGLRVEATDADVAWGSGAALRGTSYDLVLALCGRRHALSGLEGPGTDVIAAALAP